MHDTEGSTASSALAINEKRPHRPGGCVGVLYNLFDWNRRFVKEKFFFKKLLPPARPKQASRKFGEDDKLPKLRLIADENRGGFPKVKKHGICKVDSNQRPGMRAPSLVVRLMGLESMPAIQKEKLKKASIETDGKKAAKSAFQRGGFDCEDPQLEKESVRTELRPQKLQKTGSFERQPLSRFGTEAFQFKSILSRSRKHSPKLIPPVKSPGMNSRKNASRLIGAAARILEPGLQAANRTKCALAYSSPLSGTPKDEATLGESTSQLLNVSKNPSYHVPMGGPLKEQPCKNCGSMIDVTEPSPNMGKYTSTSISPVPNFDTFHGCGGSKPGLTMSLPEGNGDHIEHLSVRPTSNKQNPPEAVVERKCINQEGQILWCQQWSPRKNIPAPVAFKLNPERRYQVLLSSGRLPHRSKIAQAMAVKMQNAKYDAERKISNKQDNTISTLRKRRLVNANQQVESTCFISCTPNIERQKSIRHEVVNKGSRLCVRYVNGTHLGENGISSPMKQRDIACNCVQKFISSDKCDGKINCERSFPLSGDAVSAFLEQKLMELNSEVNNELSTEGTPRRTAAMIIQEVISALTTKGKSMCHGCSLMNKTLSFPTTEAGTSLHSSRDIDHLSPGSVLEAYSSNESCLSSNQDNVSGSKPHYLQPFESDVELLDSTTLLGDKKSGLWLVGTLLNNVSGLLTYSGLNRRKLADAKEVILNAELVFCYGALQNPYGSRNISISHFLIHELETLSYGIMGIKDERQSNEFVFDCVIECLDSRYGLCSVSGLKASARIPSCMTADKLISLVVEETRRWAWMARKTPDEIIEMEMSHSLGKWTEFEIEAYELGVEIGRELLQILLDEVVLELCKVDLGHRRFRRSPH